MCAVTAMARYICTLSIYACMALCRYGFMPHRVAFWIYWQALRLLIMGVPFFGYPAPECQDKVEQRSGNPKDSAGRRFWWQAPKSYPWNAF